MGPWSGCFRKVCGIFVAAAFNGSAMNSGFRRTEREEDAGSLVEKAGRRKRTRRPART
jgi:hypothetical protein